ncbi:MAG: SLBB domain-containing protein [Muribaculaceae bacterium]|nr:SLBB domain-containing protein [Muribaculaceae bacterium]
MKRNLLLGLFMGLSLYGFAMTDQQVISYIKQQSAAGKSQQQIGQDLLSKGVTPEQAQRIKAQYSSTNNEQTTNTSEQPGNNKYGRNNVQNNNTMVIQEGLDESTVTIPLSDYIQMNDELASNLPMLDIYGHDIFLANELFAPNNNLATPQNYKLGPGDEVIIDIWGANEEHLRQTISPEGSIMIEQLGPVYLNGMTVNEAGKYVKSAFSKKYAGMNDQETDIQLTLGQVRSIQVNVLGEVGVPGTFQVSPFTSVLNALYLAQGIGEIGSLRNIQVLRNGKKVAGVDIYELLTEGKSKGNITLEEGDVIIVPPYDQLVKLEGNVKRPMFYELKPNETIQDLLKYAGGFTGDAYTGMLRLSRQAGTENELYNVENGQFESYQLQNGDVVTVGTILDRYTNRVELRGSVFRPGQYAISPNVQTVGQLIAAADGLTEDAFTGRALLYREGPELQLQVLALDLADILSGRVPDIQLQRNDILEIANIRQMETKGQLTIQGQVFRPGNYPYAEGITLEDMILRAGGLREGASTARVDVARRIVDPASLTPTEMLSETFSLSVENGLAKNNGQEFVLMPFDVITVYTSPGYEAQQFVNIEGEVLFAGSYALEKRNERLSELVKRAGGIIDGAYMKGAYLERRLSESEYEARQETLRIARMQSQSSADSIALNKIDVSDRYNVGIDLEMAVNNPGSTYDVVLQEGDRLFVPQLQSTVKIAGDVMFPNAVVYVPGKKLKYYINQAGGYGSRAKKNKAFIVYMNGTVTKAKANSPIEPGCQIIVPTKPASSGPNWAQIMAITSSFTSVAALAATITNIIR